MRALRNIAIIALLALVVAAVPGGGNAADGILAAITVAFLSLIGAVGYVVYRQNKLTYMTLDDRQRWFLLGGIGGIVLMIAGADELLETGPRTLVWIGVLGLSIFAVVRVVAEARSL